jgi:hypothetical protein
MPGDAFSDALAARANAREDIQNQNRADEAKALRSDNLVDSLKAKDNATARQTAFDAGGYTAKPSSRNSEYRKVYISRKNK